MFVHSIFVGSKPVCVSVPWPPVQTKTNGQQGRPRRINSIARHRFAFDCAQWIGSGCNGLRVISDAGLEGAGRTIVDWQCRGARHFVWGFWYGQSDAHHLVFIGQPRAKCSNRKLICYTRISSRGICCVKRLSHVIRAVVFAASRQMVQY